MAITINTEQRGVPGCLPNRRVDDSDPRAEVRPKSNNAPYPMESRAVELTISREGREFYRTEVQNINAAKTQNAVSLSPDEGLRQKSILPKLGMSAEDGLETQFHKRLLEKNGVFGGNFDKTELKRNCSSVYEEMRDEISKGYAQGTRERWVADGDSLQGAQYRKLTEEEEIAALNKVFRFYNDVVEGYSRYRMQSGINNRFGNLAPKDTGREVMDNGDEQRE